MFNYGLQKDYKYLQFKPSGTRWYKKYMFADSIKEIQ